MTENESRILEIFMQEADFVEGLAANSVVDAHTAYRIAADHFRGMAGIIQRSIEKGWEF